MGCSVSKKQPLVRKRKLRTTATTCVTEESSTGLKHNSLRPFSISQLRKANVGAAVDPDVLDTIVTNNVKLGMIVCMWYIMSLNTFLSPFFLFLS